MSLLGVSAYQALPAGSMYAGLPSLDDPQVEALRMQYGGQLAPLTGTQTRWYLSDLEAAEHAADTGDMAAPARLMRSARRDGIYAGVLSTRTGGLVRLPKRFRGRVDIVAALEQGHEETRSVFDEMFPATELALLAKDGFELGVGVGELVPVEGRDYPVFVRLAPEFLFYRWNENRWYYRSIIGLIPITPGDGRWVLHTPGGRMSPWQNGAWKAIGRAYIRKEHASLYKDSWEAKLANPARVAISPQGASEEQKQSWFQRVMAWGVNTVFGMTPGYDVKLLESNGRGWDSFNHTIEAQNQEMIITVAGQTVTTSGGAGFSNSDIHKSIRADLIKETADGLAYTINTQGLPMFIAARFGEESIVNGAIVEWDVQPPKDRNSEASAMVSVASAISTLTAALAEHGVSLDVRELCDRFGIPTSATDAALAAPAAATPADITALVELARGSRLQPTAESITALAAAAGLQLEEIPAGVTAPKRLDLAPTDLANVVLVSEARASQGLPPLGDERDGMSVTQAGAAAEATPPEEELAVAA